MKKPTKIALITASIFILCGLAFCVASLAVSEGDWKVYQTDSGYVRREQAFAADAISAQSTRTKADNIPMRPK